VASNIFEKEAQVFGNSGSSIASPVPGQEEQRQVAQVDPSGAIPNTPPPVDELAASGFDLSSDDELTKNGFDLGTPVQGMEALSAQPDLPSDENLPPEEQFNPDMGFLEANFKQFDNFKTRAKAGLAGSIKQKRDFLEQEVGEQNVVMKKGRLWWRSDENKKFSEFDPNTLEVITDLFADPSREIIMESAMFVPEVVAGLVSGPLAIAARVATLPAARALADKVAQEQGLPPDTDTDTLMENLIGMTAEATMPFIAGRVMKRLPGTQVYKDAIKKGESEFVALAKQSHIVKNSINELEQEGIQATVRGEQIGLPDADVTIMPHQLNPASPKAAKAASEIRSETKFINAQTHLAEDWGDLAKNVMDTIAKRGKKGFAGAEGLAKSIQSAVKAARKSHGESI